MKSKKKSVKQIKKHDLDHSIELKYFHKAEFLWWQYRQKAVNSLEENRARGEETVKNHYTHPLLFMSRHYFQKFLTC